MYTLGRGPHKGTYLQGPVKDFHTDDVRIEAGWRGCVTQESWSRCGLDGHGASFDSVGWDEKNPCWLRRHSTSQKMMSRVPETALTSQITAVLPRFLPSQHMLKRQGKNHVSWGVASIRFLLVKYASAFSWLMTNLRGPRSLWVVPCLSQGVLSCLRRQVEQAARGKRQ